MRVSQRLRKSGETLLRAISLIEPDSRVDCGDDLGSIMIKMIIVDCEGHQSPLEPRGC